MTSSSINLQTTSGVLSQMTIYTWPMETSFQQTIFQMLKAIGRNCLHLGRIQRQPPDSYHILDMPVLIVYTTTMAFNI
jgi:hypothetical protein